MWNIATRHEERNACKYEACPESKDTSRVGRYGNFLCLLWQHCCRPRSFTCKSCSFDSGRTGFVWVRRVWNGSADPKFRQMRGAFRHTKEKDGFRAEASHALRTGRRWISGLHCDWRWNMGFSLHSWKFDDDDEVQDEVTTCFKVLAADFYDSGIQKLVPRQ